ncbi:Protein of unknown function [Pyronema omphalodes CBS 100304]|uniref:Uncharacterized protein n=1 Tax=Pyronema omphalodes (strain CBS 100304) TaxID=1076935 RepID=U4LP46_PYROM|nr:Protein of unknown function [Pyronema omphalodes CBS 100304]
MELNTESPGYESETLSSSKIAPLDSPDKSKDSHNSAHASVIGEDYILLSSHIAPFESTEGHKMGSSQQGGHHDGHHKRRDSHAERDLQREREQHEGSARAKDYEGLGNESSMGGGGQRGQRTMGGSGGGKMHEMDPEMGTGMRLGEKVVEHGKGGMEMRKDL